MAQYWLQTPIENAKEVVQRFVDDNSGTLTGLAGKKVGYLETTEIIMYANMIDLNPYLNDEIYFGTWYLAAVDSIQQCVITDGVSMIDTFAPYFSSADSGQYPYIIWNQCITTPLTPSYFVGYRFSLV